MSGKRIAVLSSAGGGGGGIAAKRMANAIDAGGRHRSEFIDIKSIGEALPQSVSPQKSLTNNIISDTHFTVEYPGFQRGWIIELLSNYDLINIHWASYLLSMSEILELAQKGKPILFMLHDFYYTTGGCHYPATCDQFGLGCHDCPQLDTSQCSPRVIQENYKLKKKIFSLPNVKIAAPSAFLRDAAVESGIISADRAHVLRNAYVPTKIFDVKKPFKRRILLIADSLNERRKHMQFALKVLAALHEVGEEFVVDVVGTAAPELLEYLRQHGVNHTFHGRITEHSRLVDIMSQADILLSASLEDNWPNILVEAGSYGVMPVVGPGHGCAEFVKTFDFGEIAASYEVPSFVNAMIKALSQKSTEKRAKAVSAIRQMHDPKKIAGDLNKILDKMPENTKELAAPNGRI
ncbi:glycosyltransferase [Donghicola sp.]|uniref:glycosyltransferase n=1 Tax=Donghicola sp. TaxID=1929294 RepID=UPI0025FE3659|nr:glycosyltransferase [Donghicola sp.]MCT4577700.1 glycosyltransferase [Donghicola sp.]